MANFPTIPERLQQIDQLTVYDHFHIGLNDDCYYLWERISGARYDEYPTNDFIKNLQIEMEHQEEYRWRYKQQAIRHAATALGTLIPEQWSTSTFVPIPPSLAKSDPGHDPRLLRILGDVRPRLADVRELVLQTCNTVSKQKQVGPHERADNYQINEGCERPDPEHIVVFDDVLTGGSHYAAMKIVLANRYPEAKVSGLFLARAIHPNVTPII